MSKYFTADTHFGHGMMARLRNMGDTEDMDNILIHNWNSVVGRGDEVYHLGDFGFGTVEYITNIRKRLEGQIYLILGNHDSWINDKTKKLFGFVKDYHYSRIGDYKYALCHYPMASWRSAAHGSYHLHGHSHNSLRPVIPHRLDVGVDGHEFRPWRLEEIVEYFKGQTFNPVDHHA